MIGFWREGRKRKGWAYAKLGADRFGDLMGMRSTGMMEIWNWWEGI